MPVTFEDRQWREVPAILSTYVTGDTDLAWLFDVISVDNECWTCAGTGKRQDTLSDCGQTGTDLCRVDGMPQPRASVLTCLYHACYECGGIGTRH